MEGNSGGDATSCSGEVGERGGLCALEAKDWKDDDDACRCYRKCE